MHNLINIIVPNLYRGNIYAQPVRFFMVFQFSNLLAHHIKLYFLNAKSFNLKDSKIPICIFILFER